MKTKVHFQALAVFILGFLFFVPRSLAAAFGIAPPWIINENLKPGSSFVYVIDLNTNDPSEEMLVKTEVLGAPEILKWVTVQNQENLVMPVGQQHVPMYVEVKIPQDAKLGKYKGDISVTVMPKNKSNEDVAIYLGGRVSVQLQVINRDVVDYFVRSVSVEPIVSGQPLSLTYSIKNLGNVDIATLKTEAEITDYKTGAFVAKAAGDKLFNIVPPQATADVKMSIPIPELPEGNYWVNIKAYKGNKVVYQNKLYLPVSVIKLNNVAKTSVKVGNVPEAALKKAPEAQPKGMAPAQGNNVRVKTTVTVRAPLTNKLIGVVIILLGILILVTARINTHLNGKRHAERHHK